MDFRIFRALFGIILSMRTVWCRICMMSLWYKLPVNLQRHTQLIMEDAHCTATPTFWWIRNFRYEFNGSHEVINRRKKNDCMQKNTYSDVAFTLRGLPNTSTILLYYRKVGTASQSTRSYFHFPLIGYFNWMLHTYTIHTYTCFQNPYLWTMKIVCMCIVHVFDFHEPNFLLFVKMRFACVTFCVVELNIEVMLCAWHVCQYSIHFMIKQ